MCYKSCFLTLNTVGPADDRRMKIKRDVPDLSAQLLCEQHTQWPVEKQLLSAVNWREEKEGFLVKTTLLISHKSFLLLIHLSLFPFHSNWLPNIGGMLENAFYLFEWCVNQIAGLKHLMQRGWSLLLHLYPKVRQLRAYSHSLPMPANTECANIGSVLSVES